MYKIGVLYSVHYSRIYSHAVHDVAYIVHAHFAIYIYKYVHIYLACNVCMCAQCML